MKGGRQIGKLQMNAENYEKQIKWKNTNQFFNNRFYSHIPLFLVLIDSLSLP